MVPEDMISVEDYCLKYTIEETFVRSLGEYGLIELIVVEDQQCIPIHQLQSVEKFASFYYDLNINLDGIDAIHHLLHKIETLQREVTYLKSELSVYRHSDL